MINFYNDQQEFHAEHEKISLDSCLVRSQHSNYCAKTYIYILHIVPYETM